MGYFYAGGKTNQQIHARGKIGESNQKYLSSRVGKIRNDEGNFVVFEYLEIPNSTKAITRSIEGDVRLMLERAGYKNIQNDHFVWKLQKNAKWKIITILPILLFSLLWLIVILGVSPISIMSLLMVVSEKMSRGVNNLLTNIH